MNAVTNDGMKTTKDILVQLFLEHASENRENFIYFSQLLMAGCAQKPEGIDEKQLKTVIVEFSLGNQQPMVLEDTDLVHVKVSKCPAAYVRQLVEQGFHVAYAYTEDTNTENNSSVLVIKFYMSE